MCPSVSRLIVNIRPARYSKVFLLPRHGKHTARCASTARRNWAVDVPVGGSGTVSLNISVPQTTIRPSVVIYLPTGPIFQDTRRNELKHYPTEDQHHATARPDPSSLNIPSSPTSTTVTINYRLGDLTRPKYKFPTPIHDTLAAFDWVTQNLQPPRLGILGAHIGGSLALMLALTEAQSLHAVAAIEPVCDWTELDEYCAKSADSIPSIAKARSMTKTRMEVERIQMLPDLIPLLKARESLFATPGRYFDPFVSPMLLLRSAGKDVPGEMPKYLTGPQYPVPVLKTSRKSVGVGEELMDFGELFVESQFDDDPGYDSGIGITDNTTDASTPGQGVNSSVAGDPSASNSKGDIPASSSSSSSSPSATPTRRRKSLSRWPPYGMDYGQTRPNGCQKPTPKKLEMTLPHVRLFIQNNAAPQTKKDQSQYPSQSPPTKSKTTGETEHKPSPSSSAQRSRPSKQRYTSVLAHQADEMVDVMRRACFWGRGSGYAEERVSLSSVDSCLDGGGGSADADNDNGDGMYNQVWEWVDEKMRI